MRSASATAAMSPTSLSSVIAARRELRGRGTELAVGGVPREGAVRDPRLAGELGARTARSQRSPSPLRGALVEEQQVAPPVVGALRRAHDQVALAALAARLQPERVDQCSVAQVSERGSGRLASEQRRRRRGER